VSPCWELYTLRVEMLAVRMRVLVETRINQYLFEGMNESTMKEGRNERMNPLFV
jgi:hypothetical protein